MYFSYKKKSKKKANLEAKEDQRKEGSHIEGQSLSEL